MSRRATLRQWFEGVRLTERQWRNLLQATGTGEEMAALERQEAIYQQLRRERLKGRQADSSRIDSLEQQFQAAQEEAQSYIEDGECQPRREGSRFEASGQSLPDQSEGLSVRRAGR